MLEAILLKYLTEKGKTNYFIGVVVLMALVAFYVFGIEGASLESGQSGFLIIGVSLNLVWAVACYLLWKEPKEVKIEETESTSESSKIPQGKSTRL